MHLPVFSRAFRLLFDRWEAILDIHLSTKLNGHVRLFWFLLYQYNYLYFLALSRSTDASLFYVFNFLLDLDRIIESGFNEMIEKSQKILWSLKGAPRAKHDCVNGHISKRENVNWMEKIALFRDRSICHPAWLGKLGVNMNFRQFLVVIYVRESGILSPPWEAPLTFGNGSLRKFRGHNTNILLRPTNWYFCLSEI